MKDLFPVYIVASCCMTFTIMFGSFWDNFVRDHHVYNVQCSVTLVNMATKYQVTLSDECEVAK